MCIQDFEMLGKYFVVEGIDRLKIYHLNSKEDGYIKPSTPPKLNMEPKNGGLEDVFPFHTGDSQVPC